ncbi:MAG: hypothetical protein LBS77_01395 [Desulfovibrio sp.]|jgi:hypothetical protein|nr:hypothetical protein [Desulfovibrio sp.]
MDESAIAATQAPASPVNDWLQVYTKNELKTWDREKVDNGVLSGKFFFVRNDVGVYFVIKEIGWMVLLPGRSHRSSQAYRQCAYIIVFGEGVLLISTARKRKCPAVT